MEELASHRGLISTVVTLRPKFHSLQVGPDPRPPPENSAPASFRRQPYAMFQTDSEDSCPPGDKARVPLPSLSPLQKIHATPVRQPRSQVPVPLPQST